MYLDALFVQLSRVYGLQCWVSDPQFTSNGFTLLVNSRSRHRFLRTVTPILLSVGQICLQGLQVLQMTLAGMCPKYSQIHLLVVCTAGEPLAIVDMAMLRALVSEVLRPTKQKNVAHLVENTMCFFKIPAFWPACSVRHVFLEQFKLTP